MTTLPKSFVGLASLFIFTAWLVFMMGIPEITGPVSMVQEVTNSAINNVGVASDSLMSDDEGIFGFGIISGFLSLIWNLILIPLLFVVQILVAFAAFISILTLLPIEISGIIIALMSIGTILSLLKLMIPE